MIFLFLSRIGSRSKEFGDFHFQCLCEKVNVFVRGYILLQLDVAETSRVMPKKFRTSTLATSIFWVSFR